MRTARIVRSIVPLSAGIATAAVALMASDHALAATTCQFNVSGKVERLKADCQTDATIFIPNGYLLDGQGHTITAVDPSGGTFTGAVLQNDANATLTRVQNVKIQAGGLAVACRSGNARLAGIRFDGAGGTINNVSILAVNEVPDGRGCQEGNGIEARNAPFDGTHPATKQVVITSSAVQDYQKTGILANGDLLVTLSGTDVGASAAQANLSANAVQLGFGASGTVSGNTIKGNQNLIPGGADGSDATAVIIYQAPGVTLNGNRIGGNANVGVDVEGISLSTRITGNQVIDETQDGGVPPDDIGIFISSDSAPGSRVAGNTIRCYANPVEIESQAPNSLGSNTVQACNQVSPALQVAARMARHQGQARVVRAAVSRP